MAPKSIAKHRNVVNRHCVIEKGQHISRTEVFDVAVMESRLRVVQINPKEFALTSGVCPHQACSGEKIAEVVSAYYFQKSASPYRYNQMLFERSWMQKLFGCPDAFAARNATASFIQPCISTSLLRLCVGSKSFDKLKYLFEQTGWI